LLQEVLDYRAFVDAAVVRLLNQSHPEQSAIEALIELGTHHEQQHQELFFTDIKYSLSRNPLLPAYSSIGAPAIDEAAPRDLAWLEHPGGCVAVGYRGDGFCFDNEQPAHDVMLQPFALADRLVTNAEYQAFIDDGGYRRPELWLSDGWSAVSEKGWQAPLYWLPDDAGWREYTLYGVQPLAPAAPVSHLSAYEADAYARWAGYRLPTEFEWETLASAAPLAGQFAESGALHPLAPRDDSDHQLFGCLWEWTSSAYNPYPGYRPAAGAVGEYNGKFMANQLVLRGGSCVTSSSQVRATYRNFFYPLDRWQFSGMRLAKWL
jgi:ergothioneine biosynthesis protein EgtB